MEGKLPRPPGLSGHPRSTVRHHCHPCSTSDVKHMLCRLHRTRTHISHSRSIASAIHEDGHHTTAKATACACSLQPLVDLATRPPCAVGTQRGGRREEREEGGAVEATQPPRLPLTHLCPPHRRRRPSHHRQARPLCHHRCREWGRGEEWGGGSNRGHPVFQAAPTCSTTRLRRPTPPNTVALHRPLARSDHLRHEEGGRRKSPRPTGLPSAPPTVALPPPPNPAASGQTPAGFARPRPSILDWPPSQAQH
jgi:hypothetical protein